MEILSYFAFMNFILLLVYIIHRLENKKECNIYNKSDKIKADMVLNSINDPVMFFDTEYKIIKINQAVTTVLGYNLKELYFQELNYILLNHEYNEENIRYLFKNKYIRNKEINLLTADGRVLNTVYSAVIVENKYNEFLGYIITFKDITDKKAIQNKIIENNKKYKKLVGKLSYAVKHDSLTGVFNRDAFYRKMQRLVYNYKKFQYDFAIIFADLNEFKSVNDTYGHHVGDEIIIESANRLQRCMDESGLVFRMGGDEFIMILSKTPLMGTIMETKNAIRESFLDTIFVDDLEIKIGIALGYAVFSESDEDLDTMIHKADALMYADKVKYKENKYNSMDQEG